MRKRGKRTRGRMPQGTPLESPKGKPKGRRRRRWWAGLGLACLCLAATVWICADYLFGHAVQKMLTGREPTNVQVITVPNFVGELFTDGQTADPALYDVTVTYIYTPSGATEQANVSAAPRQILTQDPPPHAKRKVIPGQQRCALRLTVCLGEQQLTLPDVRGTEGREAKISLLEMGFSPTVIYCRPPSAYGGVPSAYGDMLSPYAKETHGSRGQVLYTDPPAGTQLLAGASVRVYVAEEEGCASVVCPDLRGMTLAEAATALERVGLQLGTLTERPAEAGTLEASPRQMVPETPPGATPEATPEAMPEATPDIRPDARHEAYVCEQGRCPGTWVLGGSRVDVVLAQPVEENTEPPAPRWPWFPWW